MVGIFKYASGLRFTGWVADSEEEAWHFLDEKYGKWIDGVHYGCNRRAFSIEPITHIKNLD